MKSRDLMRCAALGLAVAASAQAEIVWGVTDTQTLVSWDSATPGTLISGVAISGLQQNETIRGIDFRPATGELYAVGSFSRLYKLNTSTGVASFDMAISPALNGSSFGVDFNPTVDRLRVVSNIEQSLAITPGGGAITVGANPFYAGGGDPNIVGAAYSNNFAGATSTVLYVIDSGLDTLATMNVATGALTTVGSIGTDVTDFAGFDISGATGVAYAVVRDATLSRSSFWRINLATGAGTFVGQIDGGAVVTSLAVVPAPGAVVLLGMGGMLAIRRRR